jgi:uric acid transporter
LGRGTAGGILVLLGLLPKLGAVVAAIPAPVLGGAGLVMFGTVAASGLRTLARVAGCLTAIALNLLFNHAASRRSR